MNTSEFNEEISKRLFDFTNSPNIFTVNLTENSMNVNGKEVKLSPGMSGSVEIKTGRRRVIEYVLAPLLQHGRESLNER